MGSTERSLCDLYHQHSSSQALLPVLARCFWGTSILYLRNTKSTAGKQSVSWDSQIGLIPHGLLWGGIGLSTFTKPSLTQQ